VTDAGSRSHESDNMVNVVHPEYSSHNIYFLADYLPKISAYSREHAFAFLCM